MISQFWSTDKKLCAEVRLFEELENEDGSHVRPQMYAVDFKRDGVLVETRYFPGKSEAYAESAAYNWTIGVLSF